MATDAWPELGLYCQREWQLKHGWSAGTLIPALPLGTWLVSHAPPY